MRATKPVEVFSPGEYLRDELGERGWTVTEFAKGIGRPRQELKEILDGEQEITPEVARALSNVLGTTPEVWLNLQAAYRRFQSYAASQSG